MVAGSNPVARSNRYEHLHRMDDFDFDGVSIVVSVACRPTLRSRTISTPSTLHHHAGRIVVSEQETRHGRSHFRTTRCAPHRHQDAHAREVALPRERSEGLDSSLTDVAWSRAHSVVFARERGYRRRRSTDQYISHDCCSVWRTLWLPVDGIPRFYLFGSLITVVTGIHVRTPQQVPIGRSCRAGDVSLPSHDGNGRSVIYGPGQARSDCVRRRSARLSRSRADRWHPARVLSIRARDVGRYLSTCIELSLRAHRPIS